MFQLHIAGLLLSNLIWIFATVVHQELGEADDLLKVLFQVPYFIDCGLLNLLRDLLLTLFDGALHLNQHCLFSLNLLHVMCEDFIDEFKVLVKMAARLIIRFCLQDFFFIRATYDANIISLSTWAQSISILVSSLFSRGALFTIHLLEKVATCTMIPKRVFPRVPLRGELLQLFVLVECFLKRDRLLHALRLVDLEWRVLRGWSRLVEATKHSRTDALSSRVLAVWSKIIARAEAVIISILCDWHAILRIICDQGRHLMIVHVCILEGSHGWWFTSHIGSARDTAGSIDGSRVSKDRLRHRVALAHLLLSCECAIHNSLSVDMYVLLDLDVLSRAKNLIILNMPTL